MSSSAAVTQHLRYGTQRTFKGKHISKVKGVPYLDAFSANNA
jgi:hypothetical protein